MKNKLLCLKTIIKEYGALAVAFSGGTDSTFLLSVAKEVLGSEVVAVSLFLKGLRDSEKNMMESFCIERDIRHICIDMDELTVPGFSDNPPDRCYICKKHIFSTVLSEVKKLGISIVADGSNVDDLGDYRPGMRALKELKIRSPLIEAGLTKNEIRALSKEAELPTWNLPSSPCLSSRIPYGETITGKKLSMIAEAESFMISLGFNECRVRTFEDAAGLKAVIEVPKSEISKLESTIDNVANSLLKFGYTNVSIDPEGFKSGKLNAAIEDI